MFLRKRNLLVPFCRDIHCSLGISNNFLLNFTIKLKKKRILQKFSRNLTYFCTMSCTHWKRRSIYSAFICFRCIITITGKCKAIDGLSFPSLLFSWYFHKFMKTFFFILNHWNDRKGSFSWFWKREMEFVKRSLSETISYFSACGTLSDEVASVWYVIRHTDILDNALSTGSHNTEVILWQSDWFIKKAELKSTHSTCILSCPHQSVFESSDIISCSVKFMVLHSDIMIEK